MPLYRTPVRTIRKAGDTPLRGAVTLTGGTNVTLTQSGQDISIAASGGGAAGVVPIGGVLHFLVNFAGTPTLPAEFLALNGQTVSGLSSSPYAGTALPDLVTSNLFIRGSACSGGGGGAASHNHGPATTSFVDSVSPSVTVACGGVTDVQSNLPPYFEALPIVRIL